MSRHTEAASNHRLRPNAVGTAGIVFFVVAAAGPLAATIGASPFTFSSNGAGAAGAYLVAAVVLLVFAVGFAAMSRYVTSSGGFAVLIAKGFGERAGCAAAVVALVAYNGMLLGIYGGLGFFASGIVADLAGLSLSWEVWTFGAMALVAILGFREVNLSAKVLGTLMLLEVAILLIFDVVVLGKGGESGWTTEPFVPGNIFSGAAGVAFLFAFASFVGFEATTIYGEEARDPKRTVPRATYAAVTLIGGFYVLTTYAITVAYGAGNVGEAATADPVGFLFAMSTKYLGSFATDVMQVLFLTSIFAVVLAFHNTLARYLFSLGRAGLLPEAVGRSHQKSQAPHVASIVQSGLAIGVLGIFALSSADPLFQLYLPVSGLGTLGVLVLQAVASLAVVAFFRRTPTEESTMQTLVAPVLGAAGLAVAVVLAVKNFELLSGGTGGVVPQLPWLLVVAVVVGVILAGVRMRGDRTLAAGFDAQAAADAFPAEPERAPVSA